MKLLFLALLMLVWQSCAAKPFPVAASAPATSAATAQAAVPPAAPGGPAPVLPPAVPHGANSATSAAPSTPATPLPAPSSTAQKLYTRAKADLLQIRVLVRSGRTQASVGSGFLVGNTDLVVTNYHVMAQVALEPKTYIAEYIDTAHQTGTVELLAVDAIHDLAIVRVNRRGHGVFNVGEAAPPLNQGQYLYSLGNPLDLGFAISEGTYNGIINRSLYQQLLFTGSINAGMSGGPNITVEGQVAGVNVSKRRDGELVSFLVPVSYVQQLLQSIGNKPPADFKLVIGAQLQTHQRLLGERLQSTPMQFKALGNYRVPVWESEQMRCWGRSDAKPETPFSVDTVDCAMDASLFVSDQLQTGSVAVRHQLIQSRGLDAIRFARVASQSFRNEDFGNNRDARLSAPQCQQMFVANRQLPLRAVLCVRAYRQFAGLYDFSLLTASTDHKLTNLQTRFDTWGVSFDNGLRLSRLILDALGHGSKP
jgi:S1-C subfamily serine protease